MENELPKIDIPQDIIVGEIHGQTILNMYTNFPCRLKAHILVLCTQGSTETSINLMRYTIKANDFITILPGSVLQVHKIDKDVRIYFIGLSSEYIQYLNINKQLLRILYTIRENPVIHLPEDILPLFLESFPLIYKMYNQYHINNRELTKHLIFTMLYGLGDIYKEKRTIDNTMIRSEKIHKDFGRLVIQYYAQERNVAFYAQKLGITSSHLSTTIKQVTGKTCVDIISEMVIMDAKTQLKSTDLPIHEIAYSLNFTNMSFFGKYFKRHVGISPLEYRNG